MRVLRKLNLSAFQLFNYLLNFLMKRHFLEDGIEFLQLKTLGGILFILGSDIARHAGHTARFVLGALQNYLYPVSFFSHFMLLGIFRL